MKNATELLTIYRIAELIGLISIIVCINYLLKKLNSKLFHINFV
jgi:flagellar biogenesis protein FliO